MKVKLTDEMKKYVTLAEAPTVYEIIQDFKGDNYAPADYAAVAARAISNCNLVKVLEASAEICKDTSVWNRYNDNSGNIDIAIKFTAVINNGFGGIIIGTALLSGICDIGDSGNDKEEIARIMQRWYIRKFKEV